VVGGYLTYGTFTQTGLVLVQDLKWFGRASQKLTVLHYDKVAAGATVAQAVAWVWVLWRARHW
jgi:hypothetical protein